MTTFARTARQDAIWTRLNEIRATADKGLLSPEDGGYTGDDLEALEEEYDTLVLEYKAIHEANGTKG